MAQKLESFVRKNSLLLTITRTTRNVVFPPECNQNNWQKKRGEHSEWEFRLDAPILARILRVKRWTRLGGSITVVIATRGTTRKEARKKLLKAIRGGVLVYSNSIDRECGDDPQIKVPRDLQ